MKYSVLSFAAVVVFLATVVLAQQPVLTLTATSANVSEPGNAVRIEIERWSKDQEREQLVNALTPPPASPPAAPAAAEAGGTAQGGANRGGRGGGRGGNAAGGANAAGDEVPQDADAAGADTAPARGGRGGARGGQAQRGGGGGGGRGRGGAGGGGPVDPIAALTTAVERAQTLGFIWTNEITGYAIKYAWRIPLPDGERIILATNRRIGAQSLSWKPTKGTSTPYEFSLVEIRMSSKGAGEGKSSLTAPVAIDNESKTIGLENYATATVLLENIKRR